MTRQRQSGVALVMVTWLGVLGTLVVLNLSALVRVEVKEVGARVAAAQARAAAESGIWIALEAITRSAEEPWPINGRTIEFPFGDFELEIAVQGQSGLLDLNRTSIDLIQQAVETVLEDAGRAEVLAAVIGDARDSLTRSAAASALRQGARQRAGAAAGPRPFRTVEELGRVADLPVAQFDALASLFTVHSQSGEVQVALAPDSVLRALPDLVAGGTDALLASRTQSGAESAAPTLVQQRDRVYAIQVQARDDRAVARTRVLVEARGRALGSFVIIEWQDGWYHRAPDSAEDSDV